MLQAPTTSRLSSDVEVTGGFEPPYKALQASA